MEIIYTYHPIFHETDDRVEKDFIFSRCAISKKNRYCYFRIPKCANSTIVKTLAYYDPYKDYVENDALAKKTKEKFSRSKFALLKFLNLNALSKKYFLFTFVRNPYTRVLSAYLDKIVNQIEKKKYDPIRRFIRKNYNELTFEGFVEYLEQGGLYENPHWIPQISMILVNKDRLSFIGKIENFNEDLSKLIDHIFGPETYEVIKMRKKGRTHSDSLLNKYYTKEIAKRVYSLYKKDFEAFNYQEWF